MTDGEITKKRLHDRALEIEGTAETIIVLIGSHSCDGIKERIASGLMSTLGGVSRLAGDLAGEIEVADIRDSRKPSDAGGWTREQLECRASEIAGQARIVFRLIGRVICDDVDEKLGHDIMTAMEAIERMAHDLGSDIRRADIHDDAPGSERSGVAEVTHAA